MTEFYVIAEIGTGIIVNNEYYRERYDAIDALRHYDDRLYTIMTEEEANKVNLEYIESELADDIESYPEANPDNEDKVEEIRQEIIRESREAIAAEDEAWNHR